MVRICVVGTAARPCPYENLNSYYRSDQEQTHPIPVVLNLSSWARKRQPLATWLIEEMETRYKVPRKVGSDWINADQILPLLDGLDEVDATFRTACMQAINEYHQRHNLVPLVVCCRVNEYISQANRLELYRAVTIQPLTTEQVNEYLTHMGEQVAPLHVAFQSDPVLQELVTTPLILTILIMAYQDLSLEEIKGGVSAEVRREQIFAMYTERMLKRRPVLSRYGPEQTIHWLSLLAQQMKQQSQTVFYLERMQPSWLMRKQRRLYHGLIAGPICGLLISLPAVGTLRSFPFTFLTTTLIVGVLFGWLSEPVAENNEARMITRIWIYIRQSLTTILENRLIVGVIACLALAINVAFYSYQIDYAGQLFGSRITGALSSGIVNGIYFGLPVGLAVGLEKRIEPLEMWRWLGPGLPRIIPKWLPIAVLIAAFITVLPWMISNQGLWLAGILLDGLWTALFFVFIIMLIIGTTQGLSKRVLDERHIVTPNQGIWRSARYGGSMAIITGITVATLLGTGYFIGYSWLPSHMGYPLEPTVTDYSVMSMMVHLLRLHPTKQETWTLVALFWGIDGGIIVGLASGLYCGGAAYVQHFVLRFLLWYGRSLPFNYPRFLDYAAERILLRKVGGGYIFIHRLLLDYFASLSAVLVPQNVSASADERLK